VIRGLALAALAALVATPAPHPAAMAALAPPAAAAREAAGVAAGLRAFYAADFPAARAAFDRASAADPGDAFPLAFSAAAAAHDPAGFAATLAAAEDAVRAQPRDAVAQLRLGFLDLVPGLDGRARLDGARAAFEAAAALGGRAAAAHVGLGIVRFDERSPDRAKREFLAALRERGDDVLAREYLADVYQTDLHDPARGIACAIAIPNLVPGYADIDFHLGAMLADLGQGAAALTYLERGIALDSARVGEAGRHGPALVAKIEIAQHRYADARATLERAVAEGADAAYARTLLAGLPAPGATAAP